MGTVIKNRGTSCVGVRKTGTTLIRVSTVMGTLYIYIGGSKLGKIKIIINEFDDENLIVYFEKEGKNIWKVFSLFDFMADMDYWGMATKFKKVNGNEGFIFSNKIDKELLKLEIDRFIYDNKIEEQEFDL